MRATSTLFGSNVPIVQHCPKLVAATTSSEIRRSPIDIAATSHQDSKNTPDRQAMAGASVHLHDKRLWKQATRLMNSKLRMAHWQRGRVALNTGSRCDRQGQTNQQ
eukprot:scaffold272759_cov31-Tisochrysis_lutea.AAC.3